MDASGTSSFDADRNAGAVAPWALAAMVALSIAYLRAAGRPSRAGAGLSAAAAPEASDRALRGSVVGPGGAPIRGAVVRVVLRGRDDPGVDVFDRAPRRAPVAVTTSSTGAFAFPPSHFEKGFVEIRASAPGLAATTRTLWTDPDAPAPFLVLRLERASDVTGVVVDHDGAPIPGVVIVADDGDETGATSDACGRFLLRDVPGASPWRRYRVRMGTRRGDVETPSTVDRLTLRVARGAPISVRIADEAVAPIAGAEVMAFVDGFRRRFARPAHGTGEVVVRLDDVARTDREGRCAAAAPSLRDLEVGVAAPGFETKCRFVDPKRAAPEDFVLPRDVREPPRAVAFGSGLALPGLEVVRPGWLRAWRTPSREETSAWFDAAFAGDAVLGSAAPEALATVEICRGADVEGLVLRTDGTAVAGARVDVRPRRDDAAHPTRSGLGVALEPEATSAATDARGRFRLRGLPRDFVRIDVHDERDDARASKRLDLSLQVPASVVFAPRRAAPPPADDGPGDLPGGL
ncbi:MAG TPA: carboxypeptidase-like regulatory domain-containing protein [Planctomycetota bacterium]|nr:carboxypeptidase-like regulatory domain-containing protein [Planctomycetota bacterium]